MFPDVSVLLGSRDYHPLSEQGKNGSQFQENLPVESEEGTEEKDNVSISCFDNAAAVSAYGIAKILREKCNIRAMSDHDILYIYSQQNGCFVPCTKKGFAKVLFSMFPEPEKRKQMTSHFSREVFHFLVNAPKLQAMWDEFNSADEHLLNVKNGILNIKTLELLPHSPRYLFTYVLQVNFPQYPKTPKKFFSVLEQCFDDKRDRKLCMDSMAYTLSSNPTAKAIWFYTGAANSGKSMLLHLMRRIIGGRYVSSIPPERLEGRFDLKTALHCRANIVFELNNMKLKEVKTLKAITGGDPVPIEGKYESTFYARLPLKFLLAGNNPPVLELGSEKDDGILQRFHFLHFEHTVPPSDRISDYDRILYEQEGDDIFYCLAKRLQKFYERGRCFKLSKLSKELSNTFCGKEPSVEDKFFKQYCIQSATARISVQNLWQRYLEFCEKIGYTPFSREHLVKYIEMLPFKPIRERVRPKGEKNPISMIRGIDFVSDSQNS